MVDDRLTGEPLVAVSDSRVRLLVAARHPFDPESVGLVVGTDIEDVRLIRRPKALAAAVEEFGPSVVLIDTSFPEQGGLQAIETIVALAPNAAVLALTPDPPPYEDVALATRAGACGFVDVDAEPEEFSAALGAVAAGGSWLPADQIRPILSAVAGDLQATTTNRRARLTGILLGLIPLTGLVAALMAYVWRKYLGAIGVRPVDLAVDPASRMIDAIAAFLLVLAIVGPLLLIGTWLDLLRASPANRGPIHWILERSWLSHVVLSLIWLGTAYLATRGPEPLMVLMVGPLVSIAVIARSADMADEIPPFLRIKIRPRNVIIGCATAFLLFLASLSAETLLLGPVLDTRGEGGVVVARVLGFNAQPIRATELDTDNAPRELLYLGGNADLYVLADPCNDNHIELISVGRNLLEVIDEVTCPASTDP